MVVSSPVLDRGRLMATHEQDAGHERRAFHTLHLLESKIVRPCGTAILLLTMLLIGLSPSAVSTPLGSSAMPDSAALSQYRRGVAFLSGKGIGRDYKQALYWLSKSAEQGYAPAQVAVARIHFNGLGVDVNAREGASWFRMAAEQGYAPAQVSIGLLYRSGEGVPRDFALAMDWFRKAAAQGDAYAAVSLGFMYAAGEGVKKDARQALGWFEKGANSGDPAAQSVLGGVYADGKLTSPDYVEAYKWFNLAASGGSEVAKSQLVELERRMSAASIQRAQRRTSEWRSSNR